MDDRLTWIDTMGLEDPDANDETTFQNMLRFLYRHDLTRIKAIIWTVHPGTIRQDATLNKQAKLIDMFMEKDIWNNVIIICKLRHIKFTCTATSIHIYSTYTKWIVFTIEPK